MEKENFELQWPKDGLYVKGFVHEILNYRYHWHQDLYEISILLSGSIELCRGKKLYHLEAGDIVMTSPGTGHASFAQKANTRVLVIQFSYLAFRSFLKKGMIFDFEKCCSCQEDRNLGKYKRIRRYAAQLYLAAMADSPYGQLAAKGSMELLLAALCYEFEPSIVEKQNENEEQKEVMRRMIHYMEEHYQEKLTLQDLADFSQYNRTYVSTLFKNYVGVNFHDYLTRIRFQQALLELAVTDKNLTAIALDNGFSDLKTFNAVFRGVLHRTPGEYREQVNPGLVCDHTTMLGTERRYYLTLDDELTRSILESYAE